MSDMEKKISAEGGFAGAESVSVVERAARVVPVERLEELVVAMDLAEMVRRADARWPGEAATRSADKSAALTWGLAAKKLRRVIADHAITVDPETTRSGFTDRRASDEPGVPEEGGGLREALEALADEWDSPSNRKDDDQCQTVRHGRAIRAVLAAHPADAPEAQEPRLVPDWVRDGIEGQINAPSVFERLTQVPEPSEDVVERASEVLYGCKALPVSVDRHRAAVSDIVGRLADAGLFVDPAEAERHEHSVAWAWRCANGYAECAEKARDERDRARARVAELEAEVERLRSRALGDEQCCPDTCNGGACETCPGCAAGWCVNGHDFAADPDVWAEMMSDEDHQRWWNEARGHNRGIDAALVRAESAEARARRAEALLAELVDDDPCWFDHKGGCQAHGFIDLKPGETCPHQDAKDLLSATGQSSDATPSDGGE